MNYMLKLPSPLGEISLYSDGESLTGLFMEGQDHFISDVCLNKNIPVFSETIKWLDIYFSGKRPNFTPRLLPKGSSFRENVWKLLLNIPYGSITTYGEIAKCMEGLSNGKKVSPQAVGGAVGHNPISIIIPCHRVMGANGNLTGYAGGIDKKIYLLKSEGINTDNFFTPPRKDHRAKIHK